MWRTLASYLPNPPAKILCLEPNAPMDACRHLITEGFEVCAGKPANNGVPETPKDTFDALVCCRCTGLVPDWRPLLESLRGRLRDKCLVLIYDDHCEASVVYRQPQSYQSRKVTVGLCEAGFRILEGLEIRQEQEAPLKAGDPRDSRRLFVARKDRFRIRSYRKGDEATIVPVFNAVFGTSRAMAHWYWKFRDSPFGCYRVSLGWSEKGELVSQYAGYPVPFYSTLEPGGEATSFVALHSGDTFTHPGVRRVGLGKTGLLARTTAHFCATILEGMVPFGFGFNTDVIKKMGARYLGYRFGDTVSVWEKDLASTGFPKTGFLSDVLSGYHVEEVFEVDESWDVFFRGAARDYGFLIKRNAAYVNWRYLQCPDNVHRVFAVRKRKALVGWGVFSENDAEILWGDALFLRNHFKGVFHLLRHVTRRIYLNRKSIKSWFSPNPAWWTRNLKALGFEARSQRDGLTLCYRCFENPVMTWDTITRRLCSDYYYTWGDSDLF